MRTYRAQDLQPLKEQLQREAAEAADANDAYTRYRHLYGNQQDSTSLDWLIRTSMQRGYWDDAQYYIATARKTYGDTPEMLAKAHLTEQRLGNDRAANRLLEERFALTPSDTRTHRRETIAGSDRPDGRPTMASSYSAAGTGRHADNRQCAATNDRETYSGLP